MSEFEPNIVAFLCNWCSYAGADLTGTTRTHYPPTVKVIRVMCTGRVNPLFVAQASGAAARACIPLSQGKVKTEAQVAQVDEKLCRACGFCIEACPYEAIGLKRIEGAGIARDVAAVNEVLCKGCGACAAACLSGAIQQKSFTDEQLLSMIASFGERYE